VDLPAEDMPEAVAVVEAVVVDTQLVGDLPAEDMPEAVAVVEAVVVDTQLVVDLPAEDMPEAVAVVEAAVVDTQPVVDLPEEDMPEAVAVVEAVVVDIRVEAEEVAKEAAAVIPLEVKCKLRPATKPQPQLRPQSKLTRHRLQLLLLHQLNPTVVSRLQRPLQNQHLPQNRHLHKSRLQRPLLLPTMELERKSTERHLRQGLNRLEIKRKQTTTE